MIKAIIFDCFGVLVDDSLSSFYRQCFNNDPELIKKAEDDMQLSNKGVITHDELLARYASLAGISADEVNKILSNNPVNKELFKYIKNDLKPCYKIGFLSNAADNWLEVLFTKEQVDLFDTLVLSYDVGFAKPEPEIYEITGDRLGHRLEECVFIDDRQDYIDGAIAVGMPAFVYTTVDKLKEDLATIL
jgi:HAD superfamily hydrolase (TIGR01549 family)